MRSNTPHLKLITMKGLSSAATAPEAIVSLLISLCGLSRSTLPSLTMLLTPWSVSHSLWVAKVHASLPPSHYMACFLLTSRGRHGIWRLVCGSSWAAHSVQMRHIACLRGFTRDGREVMVSVDCHHGVLGGNL